MKKHSRNLHAPLCGIFHPNSAYVARYDALIWVKSHTNCDPHLAESLFQTHSRKYGKTNKELDPITLFWTASGIEMNVEGTEVWVKVSAEFENFEPWIQVLVDGSPSQRIMLNKGEYNICVFRNMEPGNVRNILWAYGMLGDEIAAILEEAVENYKEKTGDKHVEFFKLPDTLAGEFGSRQHPGYASHKKQQMYWWKKYVLS